MFPNVQRPLFAQPVAAPGAIHSDKRDDIISRFNNVQEKFGSGKKFLAKSQTEANDLQALDIKSDNPQNLFKGILFNRRYMTECIGFTVNAPEEQLKPQMMEWLDRLNKLVGYLCENNLIGEPGVMRLEVITISPTPGQASVKSCDVACKLPAGRQPRMLLSCLERITQPTVPQNQQFVQYLQQSLLVSAFFLLNEERMPNFGDFPVQTQQEALSQNPDDKRYYPVPIRSVVELHERFQFQTAKHGDVVGTLGGAEGAGSLTLRARVNSLKSRHASLVEQLETMERRHGGLTKRVLRAMHASQIEAMQLFSARLDAINKDLDSDTGLYGSVKRIQAKVAAHNSKDVVATSSANIELPSSTAAALKEHLQQQMRGLETIVRVLREDSACLDIIESQNA